jgi:hypothetical protein
MVLYLHYQIIDQSGRSEFYCQGDQDSPGDFLHIGQVGGIVDLGVDDLRAGSIADGPG